MKLTILASLAFVSSTNAQGFNKKCLKEYPENKLFGANIKKGSVEKSDWQMLVDEGSSITPKHRVSIIKICKDKNGLVQKLQTALAIPDIENKKWTDR